MARQRRTAETQAEKAASFWKTLRERFSLPGVESWTTTARTVVLNALFLVAVVVIVPLLFTQFRRDEVIIEPIAVPESLAAQGMTPDVVASRVWDGLRDVKDKAKTSKESIAALPGSRRVEFSFPDSGFSIESLVYHVRRLFNAYETRVAGEIVCSDADCRREGLRLRLRVIRDGIDMIDLEPIGQRSDRDYFAEAGSGVLSLLDPFVAIAAAAEAQPLKATILARRMIRTHHPDSKWAHNLIGLIRQDAGDDAAAIDAFRAAIELDADFAVARANLGHALIRGGDLAGARAQFDAIRSDNPRSVRAAEGYADVAAATGDTDAAVKHLLEAAEFDPQSPRYFARAGRTLMAAGRSEEATKLLMRSLELDPGYLPAFAELGAMYVVRDDYVSAEKIYRDAADYAPNDADAQASHGRIQSILKDWPGALVRYGRAVELEPANAEYRYEYGRTLHSLGRHEEALAAQAEALRLDPADADPHMATGDVYRDTGRPAEAIVAYRKFLELDKGSLMRAVAERWIELLSADAAEPEAPRAAVPAKPLDNIYAR
jgi:tetratricopeptide (TPR) repeat protein